MVENTHRITPSPYTLLKNQKPELIKNQTGIF